MIPRYLLRMVSFSAAIAFSSCVYGAESQAITVGANIVPVHSSLKLKETDAKSTVEFPARKLTQLMVTRIEDKTVYFTGKIAGEPFEGSAALQDVMLATTEMPSQFKVGDRTIPIDKIDEEARALMKQKMLAIIQSELGRSIRNKYELHMMQRRAHALATAGFWLDESERLMQSEVEQFIDAEIVFATWCRLSREEKLLVASSNLSPPEFLRVMLRIVPLDGSVKEVNFEDAMALLGKMAEERDFRE